VPDGSGRLHLSDVDAATCSAAQHSHQAWLRDASLMLLSVLVLDRFADYLGDQAAVPVREVAAQALACCAIALSEVQTKAMLHLLVCMQGFGHWEVCSLSHMWSVLFTPVLPPSVVREQQDALPTVAVSNHVPMQVRHGAVLAIKYLLLAEPATGAALLPLALPALMRAMHENDDDVRAAAAQACVPLVDTIVAQGRDAVHSLAQHLWGMLPALDDLSAATSSVVQLLSMLYARRTASQQGGDGSAGSGTPSSAPGPVALLATAADAQAVQVCVLPG
jgi:TATA-binding protein-associated factor